MKAQLVGMTAIIAVCGAASAQDDEDRGIPIGGFMLKPQVSVAGVYDSNPTFGDDIILDPSLIGDLAQGGVDIANPDNFVENEIDADYAVAPGVNILLSSTGPRHLLQFNGDYTGRYYVDQTEENVDSLTGGVTGRYYLTENTFFQAFADHQIADEQRSEANFRRFAVNPTEFDRTKGELWFGVGYGRLTGNLITSINLLDYKDGVDVDGDEVENDTRDVTSLTIDGSIGYKVAPDIEVFTIVTTDDRDFDLLAADFINGEPVDDLNRDSFDFASSVGIKTNITDLLVGQATVGYFQREFDDNRLEAIDGVGYTVGLDWFPSSATSVSVTGGRSVEDTIVLGASAFVKTNVQVGVTQAVTPLLKFVTGAGFQNNDFDGVARQEDILNASAGLAYTLLPGVDLASDITHFRRDSDALGDDYDRTAFQLGVVLRR